MKIAVIIPIPYGGGTLRVGKSIAKMLKRYLGPSPQPNVVFANPDNKYTKHDLADLIAEKIEIRKFRWQKVDREEAERTIKQLGRDVELYHQDYVRPCDDCYDYTDMDYWLFVSDRIEGNLLPIRRTGIIATDYIQRYVPDIFDLDQYKNPNSFCYTLLRNIRNVDDAYAMTPGTLSDLKYYVGRSSCDLLPLVLDDSFADGCFEITPMTSTQKDNFIWVTNGSQHKNHINTLNGLYAYYKNGGQLKCIITGINTHFFDPEAARDPDITKHHPYHVQVQKLISSHPLLQKNIIIMGNVPDDHYVNLLKSSRFLLHSVIADNGTFSVIEAALLGIDSISSRYPQQEYINEVFGLHMTFFDPLSPEDIASKLKQKEQEPPSSAPHSKEKIENRIWKNQYKDFTEIILKNFNSPRKTSPYHA